MKKQETTRKKKRFDMKKLNVNKFNSAFNFYEKIGFKTVKKEIIDIGNNYIMDDFVMEKDI